MTSAVIAFLARASYFLSLLGLKMPLGMMCYASHARRVFRFLVFVWTPLLVFVHVHLLPQVQHADHYGRTVWHCLFALWVTLPIVIVGGMMTACNFLPARILSVFAGALALALAFHWHFIPMLQPTLLGTFVLQVSFCFFEDLAIAGWVWCLYHVLWIQDHVAKNGNCPLEAPTGEDKVLIVGNAPTVTSGIARGADIDSYSTVVRFNHYNVMQVEHTGTKVTHHFCNGRKLPETKSIHVVLPIFNASLTHAAYLFMPHMEDARETCENLVSSKAAVWAVEEDRLLALRKKMNLTLNHIASSGMVAIDAFLSRHQRVTLHGFNFFAGTKIHYFEEDLTQLVTSWLERCVTHDPPREKIWVESLVKEGRAQFLNDLPAAAASPAQTDAAEYLKEKVREEETSRKRHGPSIVETLLKDGMPSQFSI